MTDIDEEYPDFEDESDYVFEGYPTVARRLICSNSRCGHVFIVAEPVYPVMNDPGLVVLRCPRCRKATAIEVMNVDRFEEGRDDVVLTIDREDPDYEAEKQKYDIGEWQIDRQEELDRQLTDAIGNYRLPQQPVWVNAGNDIEVKARKAIAAHRKEIDSALKSLKNAYWAGVNGFDDMNVLSLQVSVGGGICKLSKQVDSENDLMLARDLSDLVMTSHSDISLKKIITGLHDRDQCFAYLMTLLARWRQFARQTVVVTPFIGFQTFSDAYAPQTVAIWQQMSKTLDMDSTVFVTKRSSFTSLKKAFEVLGIDYADRKRWGNVSELISHAESFKGRKAGRHGNVIFHNEFHAKFYAGVFDDRVEVLTGSYNLHLGKVIENMEFQQMGVDDFCRLYIAPLEIELPQPNHNQAHREVVVEVSAKGAGAIHWA